MKRQENLEFSKSSTPPLTIHFSAIILKKDKTSCFKMVNYNFPEDLYVKLVTGRRTERVKAEVYRRVESSDGELVHMKRAGLIWLDTNQLDLEHLAERLRDETSWDAHS